MARRWGGLHLQGRALIQAAGGSGTIVPSATVSYYSAVCYGTINWTGATAGAMFRIREVDAAASNTVWVSYIQTSAGSYGFTFGDEGLKDSATATGFHLDTDTAGTVWAAFTGFQSRSNG